MDKVYSVQGYLFIGPRTPAGRPGRQWWAGSVGEAVLTLASSNVQKFETFGGLVAVSSLQPGQMAGRLTGTFDEWSTQGLALGLYSGAGQAAAGDVAGEPLPPGLHQGDVFSLSRPYTAGVVFKSGTGAVVPAAMFRRFGHNGQAFQVVGDISGYAQPLTASYNHAGHESYELFASSPDDAYVVLDGINAVTREPVLFDIYLARFDPFETIGLIDRSLSTLPFAADVIVDPLNFDADGNGGVFNMRRKAAT